MGIIGEKYSINQNTTGNKCYILSKEKVNSLLQEINSFDALSSLFTDFSQYILSLRIYPTDFEYYVKHGYTENPWGLDVTGGILPALTNHNVHVGDKITEVQGALRKEDNYSLAHFSTGRMYIEPINPEWLMWSNYEPYVTAKIYLPMSSGYHDLDVNSIMGRYVQIQFYVDISTGMMNVYVVSYNSATGTPASSDERLEYSTSYQFGVDCPFSSDGEGLRNRIQAYTWIKDIGLDWYSSVMGGVSGGWMGMSAGGARATANTIDKSVQNAPKLIKGGSYSGNWLQTTMDFQPHILLGYKNPAITNPNIYAHTTGLCTYKTVNNLTDTYGYTVLESAHLPEYVGMLTEEAEEIERLLTSGVILPPEQ